MLISDQYQFIFVHNRKAAGTSVRRTLAPLALPPPSGRLNKIRSRLGLQRNYRRHAFRRHAPVSEAEARMPADRFHRYCKFTFVRNPWDRLVSEYEFIRGFPGHRRHTRVVAMAGIAEFVEMQIPRPDAYQLPLMVDSGGQLAMDFVGRFESLEDDFAALCERIGVEAPPLPRLNASSASRDYRSYYDAATAERVARHWREEIETFGYEFDPTPIPSP